METTMRKILWAAPALLLAILMVFACGCSEKTGSGGGDGGGNQVGQVQIIATDTLRYVPGDSASAPVTVVVSDLDGNVMAGRKVSVSLDNPTLGFLQFVNPSLRDTTNDFGRVDLLYTSVNRAGNNIIRAICEGVQAEAWPIVVQENFTVICNLTLSLSRDFLQVAAGLEDSITVTASITDCAGNGISNVAIPMSTVPFGRFTPPPVTDASGSTRTTWYSNHQSGEARITARAGNLTAEDTVVVQTVGSLGSLSITTDYLMVRANNCVVRDSIRAVLRDQRNISIVGDTIWFAATGGTVEAYGVTNTLGQVAVQFCDLGYPSETDSAEVIAYYSRLSLSDTVHVWVAPALTIGEVNLIVTNTTGIAGIDSTPVNVGVYYENFQGVTGLHVQYLSDCGWFSYPTDSLVNGHGFNQNHYHFCNIITDAGFQVRIWAIIGNDFAYSDTVFMTVNPGEARQVAIDDVNIRPLIGLNDTAHVRAFVFDSLGNHVRGGIPVTFSTTLGTISPGFPTPASTDPDGIAYALLSSGTSAGSAVVKASLSLAIDEDSTVVIIQPNEAASITLAASNTSPQVRGTGGVEFTQLLATVNDASGNPVPDGRWVTFQIMWGLPGGGININDHGLIDSSRTAGGTAIATLNSGTIAGPVVVRATTMIFNQDSVLVPIIATHGGISIVAGPPFNLTLEPNQVGVDGGGSAWELEIAVIVTDFWANPVRDGTAVFLQIIPDTAQIVSDSVFTFNEDANGDQRHGIAYALMRYLSQATFQEVLITAMTGGNPPATEENFFILPLQEPELSLYLIPDHWDFSQPGNADSRVECLSHLVDGHNVTINGATIVYGSQRGTFRDAPTFGNVQNTAITGPFGDPAGNIGETSLWLRGPVTDFFIDEASRETTCEVTIEVLGYPAATDQDLVNYRRELGPN